MNWKVHGVVVSAYALNMTILWFYENNTNLYGRGLLRCKPITSFLFIFSTVLHEAILHGRVLSAAIPTQNRAIQYVL